VLIATLVVGSLWLVGSIGIQRHQEPALRGVMHLLMAQVRADQGNTHRVADALNAQIHLRPITGDHFSSLEIARLKHGQLLIDREAGGGLVVSLAMGHAAKATRAITAQLNGLNTHHMQGIFELLLAQLARESLDEATAIAQYRQRYQIPLFLLRDKQAESFQVDPHRFTAPAVYSRFDFQAKSVSFYAWTPDQTGLIALGPIELEPSIHFATFLVIAVIAMLLVGIVVYWLVHSFELRLQRLERASSRIAGGHLNSRVKVDAEDSVGRLGKAFNRMAEQIQRLMGVQREMIRAVSHELRTPVARMRFGVQMLEDTVADAYTQKQLSAMDGDLQELDELIDEILTYARLEEGGPILEFKSSNILELVNQVAEETRRRTDAVEVLCETHSTDEDEIFAEVEQRYLHRAIQNLVGNACRYAKSQVLLSYRFQDGWCRVDVEDDGPGVPEKDWDRIFSPFTRLDDSRTRASGGYGLGLSIVQRIVYWHGGQAMVGRSRWQGAKMSLIWPKHHQ